MSGMTMVFTFQYVKSSTDHAISPSDPFLLPFANWRVEDSGSLVVHGGIDCRKPPITNLAIRPVSFGFQPKTAMSYLGRLCFEGKVKFYHISILAHDLSLVEYLFTEVATGSDLTIEWPSTFSWKTSARTPKRVSDDFVVPDGFEDTDFEGPSNEVNLERLRKQRPLPGSAVSNKEALTIDFGWLNRGISRILSKSSSTATENFSDVLQYLRATIEGGGTADDSVMQTLYVGIPHFRYVLTFLQTRAGKDKYFRRRFGRIKF